MANANAGAFCADQSEVDLAGKLLKSSYPEMTNDRQDLVSEDELGQYPAFLRTSEKNRILGTKKIKTFRQGSFLSSEQNLESLAEDGYLFVPQKCFEEGQVCKLHVAFHGCEQGGATDGIFGNLFVKYAGYNEHAAANNIVVLYPQVQRSHAVPMNPYACFDSFGFGYTGDNQCDCQNDQCAPRRKGVSCPIGLNAKVEVASQTIRIGQKYSSKKRQKLKGYRSTRAQKPIIPQRGIVRIRSTRYLENGRDRVESHAGAIRLGWRACPELRGLQQPGARLSFPA